MTPLDALDPGAVALAGDWHGRLPYACDAVRAAKAGGAEAIIHLGDFGYRFEPGYLLGLDAVLEGTPLLFVDGNHEDFDWLLAKPLAEDGTRPISASIRHLPRGLRWTWRGRTWLALGGAVSVDRAQRVEGESWWPQEEISEADVARAVEGGPVDVVIAHDSPAGVASPRGYAMGTFPAADEARAEAHRDQVRRVVDATAPTRLAHGHFHTRYASRLGATRVIGLAHDAQPVDQNLAWLDAASLEIIPPTAELAEVPPMDARA